MPGKKKTVQQPIDRPLSRAYLRNFTGWSTAYPPGASDPTTLRVMENLMVDRNRSIAVRPGLRYLSYQAATDLDPVTPGMPGKALTLSPVGTQELFYTADGSRALLMAVRELDDTVGFRAILFSGKTQAVYRLTDDRIGFRVPQGESALHFSKDTSYVKYLQINNRILALSDNGEPARLFYVGPNKLAKRLNSVSVPEWRPDHKLTVMQPDAAWVNLKPAKTLVNGIVNPSFESGLSGWTRSDQCDWALTFSGGLPVNKYPMSVDGRPTVPGALGDLLSTYTELLASKPTYAGLKTAPAARVSAPGGGWLTYGDMHTRPQSLWLRSLPLRTNMVTDPLGRVLTAGFPGWHPDPEHPADLSPWQLPDPDDPAKPPVAAVLRIESTGRRRFYGRSARILQNVAPGRRYTVAADVREAAGIDPELMVTFYSVDGSEIDMPLRIPIDTTGVLTRFASEPLKAPEGAVSMRVAFGGTVVGPRGGHIHVSNVLVCLAGESTAFFAGNHTGDYLWAGEPERSYSVFHPPADIRITSNLAPVAPGQPVAAGIKALMKGGTALQAELAVTLSDKDRVISTEFSTLTVKDDNTWGLLEKLVPAASVGAAVVKAALSLTIKHVPRGVEILVNEAMLVSDSATLPPYFDGDSLDTATTRFRWEDALLPHQSPSRQDVLDAALPALAAETATTKTLVATGGAEKNTYKMAFFYTFENEVGESAASQVAEIRVSRPWANWLWETSNAAGEPSGAATATAELCADQLVCQLPQAVYDKAVADGALRWNLYAMSWSDEEPVPVTGLLIASRDVRAPQQLATAPALPYADGSWLSVTPARRVSVDEAVIPTAENRVDHSVPPRHRSGMVAGDRMVLVGDPTNLATIKWSSNRAAESTNFTPSKGGGSKTLTSGNLDLPSDVVLWQNPQSADTITILCVGDNGRSVAHYMAPASVNQGSSGMVGAMGFEQVTGTPGTTGLYAAQVMNNALYRPGDHGLIKSTASNYNINHKTTSDAIANMWRALRTKQWIVAEQLDNRLYLLVHNALGEPLRTGCRGNEIWVLDIAAETGTWSRLMVQASSLKAFTVGVRAFMGVTTPDGVYYLDPLARQDDYVDDGGWVRQRPIPWRLETNTQGANRAHDAWAHLQQAVVTLGDFQGWMRYGVRGHTVNGTRIDINKVMSDVNPPETQAPTWHIEDALLVRREMKEWAFYAESVEGKDGTGLISSVQYRYAPISVNVGYENGSVESFEYGENASAGANDYSTNGIPVPMQNFARPGA